MCIRDRSYRAALEELGFTVTDEYYAERCNGGHYTRFVPPLMGGTPSTADVERVHDRKKALYSDFLDVVRPNTCLLYTSAVCAGAARRRALPLGHSPRRLAADRQLRRVRRGVFALCAVGRCV